MTLAGFKIGRAIDAAGKDKVRPFTYPGPEIGAPQFSSYPMRFVVSSELSTHKTSRHLGVWERLNAGGPWLMTHSVYPPASTPLPSMAGLRNPTDADWSRLSALPKTAAQDVAEYFTGGLKPPKAAPFIPSLEPRSHAYWKSGAVAAFSNRVNYPQALTQDYLQQVALVIPPKAKGKIRILSVDGQLVGAGGY